MNSDKLSLSGRTAIVTGSASIRGIGRAIALTMAEAGADVVVSDINVSGGDYDLEGTANEVRKLEGRSMAIKADISNENDVDNLIRKTINEFGTVDIMVNNAALSAVLTYQEVTRTHWEKLLNTNIIGCHNCCLSASRVMMENKHGSIINITSTTGIVPSPIFYAYGAVKAAVNHMTLTLAQELAPYNVRVNAVAPGAVDTDISIHDIGHPTPTDKRFQALTEMTSPKSTGPATRPPTRWRISQPRDVANTVLFLASDAADFMTGQILTVQRTVGN